MPIYKFWRARATEAWYQLSKEEQDKLWTKVGESLPKAGGKTVIACTSDWSNEMWQYFGVEEFPNIEAVQKHHDLLTELNWLRYVDSESQLGTTSG